MTVKLREKKLKNGKVSLYLEIYQNGVRNFEFLDIHINKKRPTAEDNEKRRLAQEIKTKREHELIVKGHGLLDKKSKNQCFIEYAEKYYKSRRFIGVASGIITNLKKFTNNKTIPITSIDAKWLKEFQLFLLGRVSNNSAFRYLSGLSSVFNEAVRDRILPVNIWNDVPRTERVKRTKIFRSNFNLTEIEQLSNVKTVKVHPQIKQAYLFSCFSGLRWSDTNKLRWDEIIINEVDNKKQYFIHFAQKKTESIEYFPMCEAAIKIIEMRRLEMENSENKSPYVFPFIKEKEGKTLKYNMVRKALKAWQEDAEISKRLHFHSARHSFASNLLQYSKEADLYVVSKLLGHKDIQTTQIYAHVRDKHKQDAVAGMPTVDINLHI